MKVLLLVDNHVCTKVMVNVMQVYCPRGTDLNDCRDNTNDIDDNIEACKNNADINEPCDINYMGIARALSREYPGDLYI